MTIHIEPFLPEMDAEWRVIRRGADAFAEIVDNAVDQLVEEFGLPTENERLIEELSDRVADLITMGESDPGQMWGLECADCGFIAPSILRANAHSVEKSTEDESHGGWDPIQIARWTDQMEDSDVGK